MSDMRSWILGKAGEFAELDSGPTMGFEIERSPEAIARDGSNTTFSADALDGLLLQMRQFVLGQLWRQWEASGRPPHKMRVLISVDAYADEQEGGK